MKWSCYSRAVRESDQRLFESYVRNNEKILDWVFLCRARDAIICLNFVVI